MKDVSRELLKLLDKYGDDVKRALQENICLDYLYALSEIRENLLDWYPFVEDAALLQVGADCGALTGLFMKRVRQVVVLDESEDQLQVVRSRYGGGEQVRCRQESLSAHAAGQEAAAYDYVVMVGSLKDPCEEMISAAKRLVKPGGRLICAVCNRFGMKYWAGAAADDRSFSRFQITRLLEGGGELEFYYPMPDYRLPSAVYSQRYLPRKGDLTNVLTVYDYPRYLLMDVGAAYDAVCEDGRFEDFANSFLTIWSKHAEN